MDREDDPAAVPTVVERKGAPSRPRPSAAPARSVFDPASPRFDEQGELGRGGMGRVVEAIDRALDRTVAIKHSLATDPENLARFEREVRITAKLQHPSVVPILDAGRDDEGYPFYVMRKIDGEPLTTRVARAPTVRERLALVPDVLGAIDAAAFAHAQGVVHRDIKPPNILLGPFGESLLIDWGLARELDEPESLDERPVPTFAAADADALTRVGRAYGTPCFMAPEQARGEIADRRADVYSLGATLYYVLAGAIPFGELAPTTAVERSAAGGMPDLAQIPEEVPVELVAIVAKALAPGRDERYADAGELAADLRRFLAGQLVAAHDYTTRQRVARWIRRHRLVTGVTVAALAVIAIVAVAAVRGVVAERDQARRARAVADARAEEMLVDRARSLIAVDPTSAVALLRALPPTSPLWPAAREVARAAVVGGVERGVPTVHRYLSDVAWSPDGRLLASAGDHEIEIYDLAQRTSRHVAVTANAYEGLVGVGWLSPALIGYQVISSADTTGGPNLRFAVLDVRTLEHRTIADHVDAAALTLGRAAILRRGVVTLVGGDATTTTLDAEGIIAIAAGHGRIAALGHDRLTVLDPDDRRRDRRVAVSGTPSKLRISATGGLVAAQFVDAVAEWAVEGDAPPRTLPPHQLIAYVGDTLHGWTSERGLVTLDGTTPRPRWEIRAALVEPAPSTDVAVFASTTGRLALVDELGLIELPHRPIDVTCAAPAPSGRWLALGTEDGELLLIDLAPVRARLFPATEWTIPQATSDRVLVLSEQPGEQLAPGTSSLISLDLATGTRRTLGSWPAPRVFLGSRTIAVTAPSGDLALWSDDGTPQFRISGVGSTSERERERGASSLYYELKQTGEVFELPLDEQPSTPRLLGTFPRVLRHGRDTQSIVSIDATPEGVFVHVIDWARFAEGGTGLPTKTIWIDDHGTRELSLPVAGIPTIYGRTADGTWWIGQDYTRILRVVGNTAVEISLPQQVRHAAVRGERVWAYGENVIYVLDLAGRVIARASATDHRRWSWVTDGMVLPAQEGLVVTAPDANVRRLLRFPGPLLHHAGSGDGRVIVAVTQTSARQPVLAMWRDPVPVAPLAVPGYLAALTNARLELGSDVVSWAP